MMRQMETLKVDDKKKILKFLSSIKILGGLYYYFHFKGAQSTARGPNLARWGPFSGPQSSFIEHNLVIFHLKFNFKMLFE